MIKRIVSVALAAIIMLCSVLPLVSCNSENDSDVKTLYVYNWGEYMSDGSEGSLDSNAAFEQWYFETYGERVEVIYSTYSSNEDMYAKLSGGAVNYDVIVPSDYMIERLIKEEKLRPLNYENIPNIKNVIPEFYGENAEYDYYDEGNVYSVPYFYGMIGIIYNTTVVDKADIGSWRLMWNEKYKGNILQFNNSRDAFGTAQYYLGIDVNSDNETEWRAALEKLKEQKDIVQGYVMDEIYNKMENGSAAIAAYYAGDFLTMYENNEDLNFFYPSEGTNLYVDAMCIPKTSQNPEIAERYINFMLSEEPAVANAEYTYYASPNKLVIENEEYIEYMSEIKEDAYEKMYALDSVDATYYKNLTPEKLALINSLWEDLKSDIEVSPTIYILCAVIIGSLVSIGLFLGIRKRIRNNY
ncbi:MAG: spermidine/putrescine ABC transporter substrate-binding protein [Ruminococcaceae bacterium]|nr:spermidine/putrescine ABC transporter substrate-binding protein [Oscillospiraceae bacterium]